jgi:hypothetical protein
MKNSNDPIGNRNRDLPTYSLVPEPTAPSRAPDLSPWAECACTKTTYTFSHTTISESLISIPRDSSTLWFSAEIPQRARDYETEKSRCGVGGAAEQSICLLGMVDDKTMIHGWNILTEILCSLVEFREGCRSVAMRQGKEKPAQTIGNRRYGRGYAAPLCCLWFSPLR